MEALIKQTLSETYNYYKISGGNKDGFYDITLSVVGWLVLSSTPTKDVVLGVQMTKAPFLFKNDIVGLTKEKFAASLKNCENSNRSLWSGLLNLDANLIQDISDRGWQSILNAWNNLLIETKFKEDPSVLLLVFEYLETAIIQDQKNDNIYIVPKELATVMVSYLKGSNIETLYDPFTRSGNLLSESQQNITSLKRITGFVPMKLTWKLAKLRLLLTEQNPGIVFEIERELEYQKPSFLNRKFDAIICNPPFGAQRISDVEPDVSSDWKDIVQKSNRPEVGYLCHILSHLAKGGRASLLLPSIFLSGNSVIKELIARILNKNILDAVIVLPQGLFSHTAIATTLICINSNRKERQRILLFDATNEIDKNSTRPVLKTKRLIQWLDQIKTYEPPTDNENLIAMVTTEDIVEKEYGLYVSLFKGKQTFIITREPSEILKHDCQELENKIAVARAGLMEFLSSNN